MPVLAEQELTQFADSMQRFVAEQYAPEMRREICAGGPRHRRIMWERYAEMGWLSLPVAEENGGLGGGAVELGLLFEACGRGLLLEAFLSTVAIAAPLLCMLGSDEQREAIVQSLITGKTIIAFAHFEPSSGHDRAAIEARAENKESVRLYGRKRLVPHAADADLIIVSARRDDGSLGLFLVEAGACGITIDDMETIDGRPAGDIKLDGTPAQALGADTDSGEMLDRVLDVATTALCAESMAIISALNRATLEFVKTRKQFGKSIGEFQVVQHRLVDMMTMEQEGWAIVRCAQQSLDDDIEDAWRIVSAAKARVDSIARFVGEQSIQLHGGIGMSDELMVGDFVKRLMFNMTELGDKRWHLHRLGRGL